MPDPVPQVIAFVIDPGNEMVVIGKLSPQQVVQVFQELADQHLPHTGSKTGPLTAIALLALILGGALLAMAGRRRQQPRSDPTS